MPLITIRPKGGDGPVTVQTGDITGTYVNTDKTTVVCMKDGQRFYLTEMQIDFMERVNAVEGGEKEAARA